VLQASGWRLAIEASSRPGLLHAIRAVIAGEAAGYLTVGPISREPVKALMIRDQTPEKVSLTAALVERIAYIGAATLLVACSLTILAVRANRIGWIVPGLVGIFVAGLWTLMRRRLRRARLASSWVTPSAITGVITLAVLQEIINVAETYVVLTWLGAGPTWESAIALEGLNRVANAPAQLIPGRLGVLELAGSTFAGILQLGNTNGLTLVLARRLRSVAWTGVGVLLLATCAPRDATHRDPALV
jgi:hypothetical protein